MVIPDLERMLRRVVLDVFDENVETAWDTQGAPHIVRVTLGVEHGPDRRTARLYASASGWFETNVPDLGVSTFQIEYDDESHMAEISASWRGSLTPICGGRAASSRSGPSSEPGRS